MKKLVIIEHEPLTIRLKQIWNIEILLEKGVDVEYWDLSQLIYKGINIPEMVSERYIKKICSISEFKKQLSVVEVKDIVFALEIFVNWKNRKILRLLRKYKCECVKIDLYANTGVNNYIRQSFWKKITSFNFQKVCNKLLFPLYKKMFIGNICRKKLSSSKFSKPNFYINHPDYELFISDVCDPIIKEEKYIVFIDVYYPLHPDLKFYFNVKNVDVDGYRKIMCDFFSFLEDKYKMKVIIAAHPKSIYTDGDFNGRKIIKGKTLNLVKHASYVITHESNSLSFIFLANKPFAMVYPETYRNSPFLYNYINNLALFCGKEAYDLNRIDWENIKFTKVSDYIRNYYIENYLSAPEIYLKTNAEIIYNKLLKK